MHNEGEKGLQGTYDTGRVLSLSENEKSTWL
jgi:hypothetical protein